MSAVTGLFVPGPTNVPESVRSAIDRPMEDHRAPDLPSFTLPLFADLKKIFKTTKGQVFLFPGSGTGGWEAAITNTLNPGDKVLASRFGQFSHLWIDLCQRLRLDVEFIEVEWGEGVPLEDYARVLAADTTHKIKAVLATQNETATGVQSDIAGVRSALDSCSHPAMLFVDGVSSIGSVDFRMDEWGVDVAVSGSQKGFMLPAGLAILCASQRAIEVSKGATLPRCYFDFTDMINTNATGYFPYTPPMSLIRGLRVSVDRLLDEGLDNVFDRHARMATGVRKAVDAWGLKLCAKRPIWYSDTVSAICLPGGFDSGVLLKHAYYRYGLSLGGGLSKVAGKVFRIGHLGDTNEIMLLSAIAGSEMAMRDLGVPVEAGSGVAAAQEYYRLSLQFTPELAKAV
ncbi:MAG: alanine-glyoxylate transaminase/serine-glyoxylate transaminase/serine-pyruvate transaminase [Granulosicoccus sp.]|jgi:alanine-glyoxylate transaminase/serine-glyoxylate transaminase/serine-pyruvate transaminase